MAMLEVENLEVYYGVIRAIKGISFEVNAGEVIALIGANGAGKTTTLHTITGLIQPKSGKIIFDGKDITKIPAHKIVSMGMAHVPEGRRIFQQLTVLENLKLGAYTRKDKAEISKTLKMVYERFPRLEERKGQIAGTLSGGEHRTWSIWETLQNTAEAKGTHLILIIDEAHRGMRDNRDAARATTIMQKFIKGSQADGLKPLPVGCYRHERHYRAVHPAGSWYHNKHEA